MSDTAAFLAGCAVTGVAVLWLMKSDFASGQPQIPQIVRPSSATEFASPQASSSGFSDDAERRIQFESQLDRQKTLGDSLSDQLRQQQGETSTLKDQLGKQQQQSETLKSQLDQQQRDTDQLLAKLDDQQRTIERLSGQPLQTSDVSDRNMRALQTVMLWVGGAVLIVVVGGGAILLLTVLVVVLLSRRRTGRTVHVVQSMPSPYPLPETRMLPARARPTKSARQIDVDYYVD